MIDKKVYDLAILIPARNEEFLARTVEGILANKRGNTQILIGLDGAWANPQIADHPDVTILYYNTSIGQRAITNQLCRLTSAKWVMKLDAHCILDEGFDVKLLADAKEHQTIIPKMYNVHAFDRVCPNCHHMLYQGPEPIDCEKCGTRMVREIVWKVRFNKESHTYRFDTTLHFQYHGDRKHWGNNDNEDIIETMSAQGSCFMLTREKYWELNISDEEHGSWGQQGVEVACKTWLSGGQLVVNKKTWYAHLFRTQGGSFGFPYPLSGKQIEHAREYSKDLWLNNKWDKQIYPLSWLLEKFAPLPDWHSEPVDMLEKVNKAGEEFYKTHDKYIHSNVILGKGFKIDKDKLKTVQDSKGLLSDCCKADFDPWGYEKEQGIWQERCLRCGELCEPIYQNKRKLTKGAVYYTDSMLPPKIEEASQRQLIRGIKQKHIVSVSLKPMQFGKQNILLPLERGWLTMFKQILAGLEALDTDVAYLVDHDVLYHPSHFAFVPPDNEHFYYNHNVWRIRPSDGFALQYEFASGCVADRELLVNHYKKRIAYIEDLIARGEEVHYQKMGFEAGSKKSQMIDPHTSEFFRSEFPNIDIRWGGNHTGSRWTKEEFRDKNTLQGWTESDIDHIPGWPDLRKRLEDFK